MIFEDVYAANRHHVLALAYKLTRDAALAEDVAQEAWAKIARALPSFRGEANISSWVYRIAFNTAISMMRPVRRRALPTIPDDFDAPCQLPSPLDETLAKETTARLHRALVSLPPIYRDALRLWMSGMPTRDGAFLLGVPEPTFKSRAHRARAALIARWN